MRRKKDPSVSSVRPSGVSLRAFHHHHNHRTYMYGGRVPWMHFWSAFTTNWLVDWQHRQQRRRRWRTLHHHTVVSFSGGIFSFFFEGCVGCFPKWCDHSGNLVRTKFLRCFIRKDTPKRWEWDDWKVEVIFWGTPERNEEGVSYLLMASAGVRV